MARHFVKAPIYTVAKDDFTASRKHGAMEDRANRLWFVVANSTSLLSYQLAH